MSETEEEPQKLTEEEWKEHERLRKAEQDRLNAESERKFAIWMSTTASPGKFRIFDRDCYDDGGSMRVTITKKRKEPKEEWDDFESAKAYIDAHLPGNQEGVCMYIFNDAGKQVWTDCV